MNLDNLISKYVDGELNIEQDLVLRDLISNDKDAKNTFDDEINLHYLLKRDSNSINLPYEFENYTDSLFANQINANESLDNEFNLRAVLKADALSIEIPYDLENQTEDMINEKFVASSIINSDFDLSKKLKEDANSIELPKKLESQTEDMIMMGIMNANPIISKIEKVQKNRFNFRYVSIAASLLLFLSIYNIDDSFRNNLSSLVNNKVISENINSEKLVKSAISNKNSNIKLAQLDYIPIEYTEKSNFSSKLIIDEQTSALINQSFDSPIIELQLSANDNQINQKLINLKSEIKSSPNTNISNYANNPEFNLNRFGNSENNTIKDVEFTTTLGISQYNDKIDNVKNLVSNKYAQSIAYFIDENQKIGFEIGVTDYNYLAHNTIHIPITSFNEKSSHISILEPNKGDNNYITAVVDANKNNSIYSGSVFYERKLFNINNIDISSKSGLGVSMNGSLIFERITARYKIFEIIYLNAGIDASLSNFNLEAANYNNSQMNKSLSFVYGFQIKF